MTDWRPIETAPLDGTLILLWDDDEKDMWIGWFEDYPTDQSIHGWNQMWTDARDVCQNPTHWAPSPDPPKKADR